MRKRKTASRALDHLHRRHFEGQPRRLVDLEKARSSAAVAREIYRLRLESGLTQTQLARLVKTTASVISRLEDDDYAGHSLSMLRRIAQALGHDVIVTFVPRSERRDRRPPERT